MPKMNEDIEAETGEKTQNRMQTAKEIFFQNKNKTEFNVILCSVHQEIFLILDFDFISKTHSRNRRRTKKQQERESE